MAGRELKQLFRAYREGDELAFRRAAQEIIEEEESKQHLALARDLRRLIAGGGSAAVAEGVTLPPPPMDREGEWPLAEIRHPSRLIGDLVLSGVSSYLGETASNLHRIFDYARAGSWVLVFDEFDALGKARDDPAEHGEIKRVITAFLQMLDGFRGSSLLVAATNHEQLLDSALWRRFDEVLEFPRPTVHQMRKLIRLRLRSVSHQGIDVEAAAHDLKGLPHAAVEKVAWDAQRYAILERRDGISPGDVERAIADTRARPW